MKAKRIVALVLVGIMVFGLCATAFATRPSVSLSSKYKNQFIKVGKKYKPEFKLKSNSYSKKSGKYRAAFETYIYTGFDFDYGFLNDYLVWKGYYFTGNVTKKLSWNTKGYPAGRYVNFYLTYTRKNAYSDWQVARTYNTNIYLYK